ncbi:hypothetical protein [Melghirimyces algeriensis]|uniref:Uncharacterized protein n=1 Tax=Melghirimyces algeriensis TaxID=910412 RepID=A0A521B8Q1_9BACL|nr:hypothetical protein [Melghirimyces algeriensis]SMO43443.1 hypothetical protein SAMN06264849_101617 [Melghirimyces algeriensis]
MKIRWPIAVSTLLISLIVLFGGFYAFQWFTVEQPIRQMVKEAPHLQLQDIFVQPNKVTLTLKPDEKYSLAKDYPFLRRKMASLAGDRTMDVRLIDAPNPALNEAWNQMVFGVKEGLAHRRYTMIRETVNKIATEENIWSPYNVRARTAHQRYIWVRENVNKVATEESIRYKLSIDDSFVYIELHQGDRFLYKVLPLHPAESEVKSSE